MKDSIYVHPDLTPLENQKGFSLRSELCRRLAAGKTDIIIRNGTIVKRKSPAVVGIADINIINPSNHTIIDYTLRTVLVFNAQALFDRVNELKNFICSFHHIPDISGIWKIPEQCL